MSAPTVCKSCELIQRRDAGLAPLWDNIYRTTAWDVVHSYNTVLPGWLVLVARRHVEAVDQFHDDEAAELGVLLRRVSGALRVVTGCLKTYVVQFAEHPQHPHVHFHVVPRMAGQPEAHRGPGIFGYMGGPQEKHVGEERMNEIAMRVRQILQADETGD